MEHENVLKEAGVLLVATILVLTTIVMVPTTVADSSDYLVEERDWPGDTNPYGSSYRIYYPGYDNGWTDEHKDFAYYYGWSQSNTANSGGSPYEAYILYCYCRANYVFYSYGFSTEGVPNCVFTFKSYIDDWNNQGRYWLNAGWSTDASTWHSVWNVTPTGFPDGDTQYDVSVSIPSGQSTLYIGFWLEGDPFWMNYWYLDDVTVTGGDGCNKDSVIAAVNAIWDYIDTFPYDDLTIFKNLNSKDDIYEKLMDDGVGNNAVLEKLNSAPPFINAKNTLESLQGHFDGTGGDDLITDVAIRTLLYLWMQQIIDCLTELAESE